MEDKGIEARKRANQLLLNAPEKIQWDSSKLIDWLIAQGIPQEDAMAVFEEDYEIESYSEGARGKNE